MQRTDFLRLVGTGSTHSDYVPIACLLKSGYGVAGYFNPSVNEGFVDTVILVNARLIDLAAQSSSKRSSRDFSDFLEEIVGRFLERDETSSDEEDFGGDERAGKTVPLTAVPLSEMAIVYPVSQIGRLLKKVQAENDSPPSFLDFRNKSVVVKVLSTKIW